MVYIGTLSKFLIKKSTPTEICGWKQGRYIELYKNGRVLKMCNYLNDRPCGKYCCWYDNGLPWIKCNYTNGKLHGTYHRWYENGQLWTEHNYINGIPS